MSEDDTDSNGVELIEVGQCGTCGEVESDGEFDFEHGPICPNCGEVLAAAWMEQRPDSDGLVSDTTAGDFLGGDLR